MLANHHRSVKPGLAFIFGLCGAVALPLLMIPDEPVGTGEENFDNIVPLEDVDTQGDPRLKRIVALVRKSTEGNRLYDHAVSLAISFKWGTDEKSTSGTYSNGMVKLNPALSDEEAGITLVHELRHGWQEHHIPLSPHIIDPVMQWKTAMLYEADACAYTAHFAAEYADETGKHMAATQRADFGNGIAHGYSHVPAEHRNFFKQAVFACLAESTVYGYPDRYLRHARQSLAMAKEIARDMNRTPLERRFLGADLTPVSDQDKAEFFSRFFVPSLESDKTLPEIDALSPEQLLKWLDAVLLREPKIAKKLKQIESDFTKLQPRQSGIKANPSP